MGKKNNLLFFLLLFIPVMIYPSGNITNYTINNGLPTFKFFSIAQDSSGIIYASSDIGIITYNGVEWKKFDKVEGVFRKVLFDSKGRLWAIPMSIKQSIYVVDKSKIDTLRVIGVGDVYDAKIYNDNVYIGFSVGLLKIDNFFNKKLIFKNNYNLSFRFSFADNKVYIINNKKRIIIEENFVQEFDNNENVYFIKELYVNGKKEVYFFSNSGLGILNGKLLKYVLKAKIPSMRVPIYNEIYFDGKQKIYFGNIIDFYIYDLKSKDYLIASKKNGFLFNGTTQIIDDKEGNIWIAGLRGIIKINNSIFSNYGHKHLLEKEVTALSRLKDYTLLGHNKGFTFLRNFNVINKKFLSKDIGSLNRILDSESFGNEFYFISQGNNLYKLNLKGEIRNIIEKSPYTFSAIEKLDNELFYAASYLLYKLPSKEKYFDKEFEGYIRDYKKYNDTLFFATTRGVFYSYNGKVYKDSVNIYNTYKYIRHKNIPFIATNKGLFKQEKDSLINIFNRIGLGNTNAYTMLFQNDSIMWVGTNKGIVRLNVDNYSYMKFDENWGLPSNEINRNAFLIDDNKLWIGTADGLAILDLENYKNQFAKPFFSFDISYVNAKDTIDLTKQNELSYNENNLEIHFNNTSFYNENLNRFEVKIYHNGDEKYKYNLKEPELRLFNLPYGNYKIEARLQNARGIWSEPIISSLLIISKPYYLQFWFLALNGIIGLALIYFIYNYLSKVKYSKLLEKTVRERTIALRANEQKYKTLVETSPEVIFLIDENFKIIFSNMRAIDLFGFDSIKEIENRLITDLISKLHIQKFKETFYFLLKDGILKNAEFDFITKYKGVFSAIVNAAVIYPDDSDKLQVIFTIKDISKLKQTERSLQKLNDELEERIKEKIFETRELLNQSPFAICIFNKNGFIEDVNSTFLNITNIDANSDKFKKYNIFEDRNIVTNEYFSRIKKVFNYGGIIITQPLKVSSYTDIFDFDIEWIRARFYSIKDSMNEVSKVALMMEDVTEQKTLEEITNRLREQKVQANKIIEAIEKERARIARDIHDGIGQMLSGVKLKLEGFEFKYNLNDNELAEAEEILGNAASELRRIVYNIHPLVLDNYGLNGALENLIEKVSIENSFKILYESDFKENYLDSNQKLLLYRIIQEALANSIKHSNAKNILLNLYENNNTLTCIVKDDGVGFNYDEVRKKGFGFLNMIQRADLLNADLEINSELGNGTEIKIKMSF